MTDVLGNSAAADGYAKKHLVGSVISAWNNFQVTGRTVIERADGCRVWDVDGNERIDWIMGWGSLVLGHRPQALVEGACRAFELGAGFMYESPRNGELSRLICESLPGAEKMRLCNSGTEATVHALRVARAVTGRELIVKFEGNFHGLNDYLLFGVDGSPELGAMDETGGIAPVAGSAGLPESCLAQLIKIVPYNDVDALEAMFRRHGADIAAIIMEPISLNIGCVSPEPGFLEAAREIATRYGALLIFDEVITGFRVGRGGAQGLFGVTPDLTCLGKALGCGMPAAALCGKAEYLDLLSPVGAVEMAGTNTGRHLTVCGTIAALEEMIRVDAWSILKRQNDLFVSGAREVFSRRGVPAFVEGWGGRIGVYIGSEQRPRNFRDILKLWNRDYHRACYRYAHEHMRFFGFLLPLGPCPEAVTLSITHDDAVIAETLDRLDAILKAKPYES